MDLTKTYKVELSILYPAELTSRVAELALQNRWNQGTEAVLPT
jgi:hypothetical protein